MLVFATGGMMANTGTSSNTAQKWKKPADQCPDGPRYKALGNSMAVPVMEWIGKRIQQVENKK